jgi:hypothetical protein
LMVKFAEILTSNKPQQKLIQSGKMLLQLLKMPSKPQFYKLKQLWKKATGTHMLALRAFLVKTIAMTNQSPTPTVLPWWSNTKVKSSKPITNGSNMMNRSTNSSNHAPNTPQTMKNGQALCNLLQVSVRHISQP